MDNELRGRQCLSECVGGSRWHRQFNSYISTAFAFAFNIGYCIAYCKKNSVYYTFSSFENDEKTTSPGASEKLPHFPIKNDHNITFNKEPMKTSVPYLCSIKAAVVRLKIIPAPETSSPSSSVKGTSSLISKRLLSPAAAGSNTGSTCWKR